MKKNDKIKLVFKSPLTKLKSQVVGDVIVLIKSLKELGDSPKKRLIYGKLFDVISGGIDKAHQMGKRK
jgi:hypothetical protein